MLDLRDDNTSDALASSRRRNDGINIPVTSQYGTAPLSPYLNFDPSYLPSNQPEFIFPEGAVKQRGRFELAFSQIGAACILGAAFGGAGGFYRGLKATTLAGQTGKLRRTQLINHVMKNGSSLANTLGVVSVMYSGFGVLLSWARGTDDSLNTLAAATATGMLFKSTAGLYRCTMGGGIGLGIASLYCLWNSREALSQLRHHSMNPAFMQNFEPTMNERQAEKILSILYSSAIIFSTISVVSLVVAWQHWAWTLDSCIDVDCECILYGVNTFSTFMGGDVKLCHFGAYGLAPAILVGLILGSYHSYRSCINRNLDKPHVISRTTAYCNRNNIDGAVVIVMPKTRFPCKQWIPAAFLAASISCLSLTHAVVLTDGYYKTCEQYKRNLIQLLGSRGREVQVIYNRLSCGGILDFMDYLQPDANNWRRGDEINTGLSLQLAIVASWLNFFTFVFISVLNLIMARQRHRRLAKQKSTVPMLAT